jgi:hypothetical protein
MPGATGFVRFFRVKDAPVDGNLIAVDICLADGDNYSVYANSWRLVRRKDFREIGQWSQIEMTP